MGIAEYRIMFERVYTFVFTYLSAFPKHRPNRNPSSLAKGYDLLYPWLAKLTGIKRYRNVSGSYSRFPHYNKEAVVVVIIW
jgi:hypothetical protein